MQECLAHSRLETSVCLNIEIKSVCLETTIASMQEKFTYMSAEFLLCLLILGCIAVKLWGLAG